MMSKIYCNGTHVFDVCEAREAEAATTIQQLRAERNLAVKAQAGLRAKLAETRKALDEARKPSVAQPREMPKLLEDLRQKQEQYRDEWSAEIAQLTQRAADREAELIQAVGAEAGATWEDIMVAVRKAQVGRELHDSAAAMLWRDFGLSGKPGHAVDGALCAHHKHQNATDERAEAVSVMRRVTEIADERAAEIDRLAVALRALTEVGEPPEGWCVSDDGDVSDDRTSMVDRGDVLQILDDVDGAVSVSLSAADFFFHNRFARQAQAALDGAPESSPEPESVDPRTLATESDLRYGTESACEHCGFTGGHHGGPRGLGCPRAGSKPGTNLKDDSYWSTRTSYEYEEYDFEADIYIIRREPMVLSARELQAAVAGVYESIRLEDRRKAEVNAARWDAVKRMYVEYRPRGRYRDEIVAWLVSTLRDPDQPDDFGGCVLAAGMQKARTAEGALAALKLEVAKMKPELNLDLLGSRWR